MRESLDELAELAQTAGGEVIGEGTQKVESANPATYIGKGKAEEFAKYCKEHTVDTVIFDDELTPAQTRNLEKIFEVKILDRTALILDIFSQRARTREGKLQIELAQLQHLLPRLTRFWGHLSRQSGGIGMRGGEGESQLEADRRKVNERIDSITRDLDAVRQQRETQRAGRKRNEWPLASIVGYTNAGKSTLLNRLTGASVLAKDILFATLDPTTRQIELPGGQLALLTDTVGFIQKLPTQLVAAFRATLEEIREADLLLHVLDITHKNASQQTDTVLETLKELRADERPIITVLNKIDLMEGVDEREVGKLAGDLGLPDDYVAVSAERGWGLDTLRQRIEDTLGQRFVPLAVLIPYKRNDLVALWHQRGVVESEEYVGEGTRIVGRVPGALAAQLAQFLLGDEGA